ncbi:hypothetical protein H4Q26_006383 [Puccinia striiformis f. sp. tritici PST-130]|nr:hypothetical protein H4Q26_006383 [Puccinia striiformis f. sp. tritici PST-130]
MTPWLLLMFQSNLAQLILKQKETRDYKKSSHPKAFFIKPTDFEFPPLSLDQNTHSQSQSASHVTPVGILRSHQYSTTNDHQSLAPDHPTTSQALHSPTTAPLYTGSPNNVYSDTDTQAQLAWLGYHQELRRDWDFWSSLSLSTLNIGTIPGAFLGILTAMEWGGPCVIFWGYMLGMIIVLCLSAVVAEIASAYPVAVLYIIICVGLIVGPRLAGYEHHGPRHLAKMLVTFHNDTTFKSKGTGADAFVFFMGTSLVTLAFGAEASAHLAEETATPAATVPKALFASTLVSYILGLILNICLIAVSLSFTFHHQKITIINTFFRKLKCLKACSFGK